MKNTNLIKQMVDKFLGWKLPKDFSPDGGVRFNPYDVVATKLNRNELYETLYWPTGTNLFNAQQAKELFEYLLEGKELAAEQEEIEQNLISDVLICDYANSLDSEQIKHFNAGVSSLWDALNGKFRKQPTVEKGSVTINSERFVVRREFTDMVMYAYAHHNGFFDWGVLCQAVKFDKKLEAQALISSMALADDNTVSVEPIFTPDQSQRIAELEAQVKNLQLVANEYNDWIIYHDAAEGDFQSFIGKRILKDEPTTIEGDLAYQVDERRYIENQHKLDDLMIARNKIKELEAWKAEALAVESEWDAQAVGKALNIPLGKSIRAEILPRVKELKALLTQQDKDDAQWRTKVADLESQLSECVRAIEHAEYMAASAESLLKHLNDISNIEECVIEPDDNFSDFTGAVKNCVYEFRKRAEKAKVKK